MARNEQKDSKPQTEVNVLGGSALVICINIGLQKSKLRLVFLTCVMSFLLYFVAQQFFNVQIRNIVSHAFLTYLEWRPKIEEAIMKKNE